VLKVIVANPTTIQAYKAGNGQPFADGSMIVELQWNTEEEYGGPFVVHWLVLVRGVAA
jgi:hypothetical protein